MPPGRPGYRIPPSVRCVPHPDMLGRISMTGLKISNLGPQYSWGSRVDGVTWDNIHDEVVRARLQQLLKDRGFIVFENMDPTAKMQVELSKVFGPIKDHPTKSTPRAARDEAQGVIDMHY